MATAQQALQQLDQDYQARRAALLAEQRASEQRSAELAKLHVTQQEEARQAEALQEAQAALQADCDTHLTEIIADLVGDCHAAQEAFRTHWNEIEALIAMAEGFQARGEALAEIIGRIAGRNEGAFENDNQRLDWVAGQIALLPHSQSLNIAPAELVGTDKARLLGIKVFNQHLLGRSYNGRVSSGLAAGRREALSGK